MSITENLINFEKKILAACEHAKRAREEVTLIAVSKVFPVGALLEAYRAGARHFGENYVQEFESKWPEAKDLSDAKFHFIGHLQSNKARRAADIFHCVQTVDSLKVAQRLNEGPHPIDIFLEVKLSEEGSKAGIDPMELPQLIDGVRALPNLRLRGLMTMPPWSEDPEVARPYFARLRELGRQHELKELSMGMSHDFAVAIEEGSTMIRVGTAIFGRRVKP
ncbi:MAG: YggS family pyridoxal phosphate-dependent enzyme [Bryobacteraceae bacterium]|nr:YggS family pyridoxal phosphate-dependent enzyme [Bryobacteraceae bacterium]